MSSFSGAPWLVLDAYVVETGGTDEILALADDLRFEAVSPARGDALPRDCEPFEGLVVTGSEACAFDDGAHDWVVPALELVEDALERRRPVLGICFGHQLLARAACGRSAVRRSPTPEIGWREVEVLGSHALFAGIERRFTSFCSHYDEVHTADERLLALARSARCAIHAFEVVGRPALGLQFHPEMAPGVCARLLGEHLARIHPDQDLATELGRAIDQRELARKLFANFRAWANGSLT